jgi:ABC-type branched-subunit amino acid transport system permease subunit
LPDLTYGGQRQLSINRKRDGLMPVNGFVSPANRLSPVGARVQQLGRPEGKFHMAKIISLLLLGLMVVQIIRPLGLPGLRKRGDFWKIALIAIAAMMLTVLVRPE